MWVNKIVVNLAVYSSILIGQSAVVEPTHHCVGINTELFGWGRRTSEQISPSTYLMTKYIREKTDFMTVGSHRILKMHNRCIDTGFRRKR